MAKRTVLVAVWEYRNAKGKRRLAYFGDTVDLTKEAIELGEAVDAFGIEPVQDSDDLDENPDDDSDDDADAGAESNDSEGDDNGDDDGQGDLAPSVDAADPAESATPVVAAPVPLERPKLTATRIAWEQYALALGIDTAVLSAMTKREEIIAAVDALSTQS
jgi:hypothetical protein